MRHARWILWIGAIAFLALLLLAGAERVVQSVEHGMTGAYDELPRRSSP